MLAVGMLAIRFKEKSLWIFPITFLLFMIVGGIVSTIIGPLSYSQILITFSVFMLGTLLFKKEPPLFQLQKYLIALFAFFHGHSHGVEMPATINGILYGIGFIFSSASLLFLGICSARLLKPEKSMFGNLLYKSFGLVMMVVASILIT
jgi:urease accessory protein